LLCDLSFLDAGSTCTSALDYPPAMSHTALIPALFLLVLTACKEPDPEPNVPGEFGEACIPGEAQDSPDGCVEGYQCEFHCLHGRSASKTRTAPLLTAFEHTCAAGGCDIFCNDANECPELATPLRCRPFGSAMRCLGDPPEGS
jgi:hypothetical protein